MIDMKKALIALSMGLLMAGMLAACSGSDDITEVPDVPENSENPQNGGGKDPQKTGDDPTEGDSFVVDMLPRAAKIDLNSNQLDLIKKNNDKFGYQRFDFLYLEDTMNAEQRRQKTLQTIKDFFNLNHGFTSRIQFLSDVLRFQGSLKPAFPC